VETNLKRNQTVTYIFKHLCRYVQGLQKYELHTVEWLGKGKVVPVLN